MSGADPARPDSGPGSLRRHRAAAQRRLDALTLAGEGNGKDILAVVAELRAVPFEQGAPRVYTVPTLDDHRDRDQTLEERLAAVRQVR